MTTEPRRGQHGEFIWYELMTDAPDAASAFYAEVVGWTVASGDAAAPIDYRIISAEKPVAGMLGLDRAMLDAGARPAWLGYLGADDVDAAAAAVAQAGGAIHLPPADIPGVGRFALVADPQGNRVYLMRGAGPERSDSFSETAMGRCSWNELATSDQAGALHFYGTLFGLTRAGAMPMGAMGDYVFVQHGQTVIGAMMTAQEDGRAGWTFYFRVPDIDAAAERVASAGGTVRFGPSEVPGGQRVLIATDPQGAVFGLVARDDERAS